MQKEGEAIQGEKVVRIMTDPSTGGSRTCCLSLFRSFAIIPLSYSQAPQEMLFHNSMFPDHSWSLARS